MRRLICAAIAAMLVAFTGLAGAHQKNFPSRVTIHEPTSYSYKGRVFSDLGACVRNRTVQVWRDDPGPDDSLLGSTATDQDGRWSFGLVGEEYYAKVTRVVRGAGGHVHVCLSDKSPSI